MAEGYLLLALGNDHYYGLAAKLMKSIARFDRHRPICVYTDQPTRLSEAITRRGGVPNSVTIKAMESAEEICNRNGWKTLLHNNAASWTRFGLIPKLILTQLSPFTDTLYLDVDMLFHNDIEQLWSALREHIPQASPEPLDGALIIPGISDDRNLGPPAWHWGGLHEVSQRAGFPVPQTWTTALFLRKGAHLSGFLGALTRYISRIPDLALKAEHRGSHSDEIFYALYLGETQTRPCKKAHDWLSNPQNCSPFVRSV